MGRVEAEDEQQMIRDRGWAGSGALAEWIRSARVAAVAIVAAAALTCMAPCAFAAGMAEEDVPATSVVPDSMESSPAPLSSPSTSKPKTRPKPAAATEPTGEEPVSTPPRTTSTKRKTATHHRSSHASVSASDVEVEPGSARLKLIQDTWAYSAPAKHSKRLEQVHKDKYVVATGSTRYYLQVKLKNGETAYIEPSAVDLITQTDKIFQLTHDAAVLEKPNRWAKKVAEVHQPHNVHVIGLALNYMMIRMKNGQVGFIPTSALE